MSTKAEAPGFPQLPYARLRPVTAKGTTGRSRDIERDARRSPDQRDLGRQGA